MELIEPSPTYLASYKSALTEFEQQGVTGFWKYFGPINDEQAYLHQIKSYQHVAGAENEAVPASVFWLVDGTEFIGHISVRHSLNAALMRQGGHIGYAIRPSRQREGYGSELLKLALPRVRRLDIQTALVTCDQDNLASRRVIEKNGGALADEIEINGVVILHYLISL